MIQVTGRDAETVHRLYVSFALHSKPRLRKSTADMSNMNDIREGRPHLPGDGITPPSPLSQEMTEAHV